MSRKTNIWLITAASLVIIGIALFAVTMAANGWDFNKLNTAKTETNVHEIDSDFKDISIDTKTADVKFVLSDDGKCKVICEEPENEKHSVKVEDGVLEIGSNEDKEWYEYIGFNLGSPKITIYLPEKELNNLKIDKSTGGTDIPKDFKFNTIDISGSTGAVKSHASVSEELKISLSTGLVMIEDTTAEKVNISLTTGRIEISNLDCKGELKLNTTTGDTKLYKVNCGNLVSTATTGDLEMSEVMASGSFSIERDTGDVEFDKCDAQEIFIETDTGDVDGSLLTEKIFFVTTDTGDVEVPKTASGGRCEITTDTGDIKIDIE